VQRSVPTATGASAGGSASGSAASAAASRASGGSSSSSSQRRTRAAAADRRQRREHNRKLRRDVDAYAGCLGSLPGLEGRLLSIRAGLGDRAPASRAKAARRLGISRHRERVLERRGLHRLRRAGRAGECDEGVATTSQAAVFAAGAGSIAPLQPAVLLSSRPSLKSPAALRGGPSGRSQATRPDAHATPATGGNPVGLAHGAETSSKTAGYIVGLATLALLLASLAVAWRRRQRPSRPVRLADQTGTAAVWWPATAQDISEKPGTETADAATAEAAPPAEAQAEAPEGAPAGETWVDPSAAAAAATPPPQGRPAPLPPPPGARSGHRGRRPVAVALASLLSLGVAMLGRRRHRR